MFDPGVQQWIINHPAFLVLSMILPIIGVCSASQRMTHSTILLIDE